jgi:hypothetical protein
MPDFGQLAARRKGGRAAIPLCTHAQQDQNSDLSKK